MMQSSLLLPESKQSSLAFSDSSTYSIESFFPKAAKIHKFENPIAKIADKLKELMLLPAGWDGYEAKPVSPENAYFTFGLLQSILLPTTPLPQLVPGVSGDIQIEWSTEVIEMELHIKAPYEIYFWSNDAEICPLGEEILIKQDFRFLKTAITKLESNDRVAAA